MNNPLDIKNQIAWLSTIKDGWMGRWTPDATEDQGIGIDPERLPWLEDTLIKIIQLPGHNLPHLFPTPEGNVQAEWDQGELQINLATGQAEWFGGAEPLQYDEEHALNLNCEADCQWLTERLATVTNTPRRRHPVST